VKDRPIDRTKASFAEAEGKTRFPAILKWGEIDQRLRASLWNQIFLFLKDHIEHEAYTQKGGDFLTPPAHDIMLREFVFRRHKFVSDWDEYFYREEFLEMWSTFFREQNYIEILDFVTFFVRDPDCPKKLIQQTSRALDQPFSPYRLSESAKTIFPVVGEEQTKSLERDLEEAFRSAFAGSKSHLQTALQSLGNGDHRATVRESIHAVESAIRDFTGDTNAVLSKALKSLVSEQSVHKALADAFDKLYAYSSDENGIRHALVFGDNEKVGLDEAVFFLSACTAFVGFLSRKKMERSKKD
jgi:hypothetical protein